MSHVPTDYTENILDHNQHPRNWGTLTNPTIATEENNPLCGDKIHYDLKFKGEKLVEIGFSGKGCAISKGAGSILSEWAVGKTKKELEKLDTKDIYEMIGIELSPARAKCGMLGFAVLKKALTLIKIEKSTS